MNLFQNIFWDRFPAKMLQKKEGALRTEFTIIYAEIAIPRFKIYPTKNVGKKEGGTSYSSYGIRIQILVPNNFLQKML